MLKRSKKLRQNNNVYLKNNNLYEKVDKKEIWLARGCGISSMQVNVDTGCMKANLYFDTVIGLKNEVVERQDYLTANNLIKLQNKGFDVMNKNAVKISEYLRNEEEEAPVVYRHSGIGFGNYNNKLIYKLDKCIGLNSEYEGQIDLKSKGSKEKWLEMFQREVVGQTPLELITIISLSAIVLGFIGEKNALDTIVVYLSGNSTTGKSTALKLATSIFGYPDVKNNGLFSTFNTTQNAMMNRLTGIIGVPISFDEISMNQNIDFTSMVYQWANGEEKKRLTKDLKQQETQSWLTVIMANGEKSLTQSTGKYAGVKVRIFEFELDQWTRDANNAENIGKVVLNNYGHIGYEFAEYIMKIGEDCIQNIYQKNKLMMSNTFKRNKVEDQYTQRRVNKLALFLATSELFEKMLNIKFNKAKMIELLIDLERESINNRNLDKSIIDYLSEYIVTNKSKFKIKGNKEFNNNIDVVGCIEYGKDFIEIEILESKFKQIVSEGGFKDSKVLLSELKKQGLLDAEADRHYRKRKINGIITKVNVIKLPQNNDEGITKN